MSTALEAIHTFDTEAGIDRPAILGGYVADGGDVSPVLSEVDALPGTAPLVSWKIDLTGGRIADGSQDAYLTEQAKVVAGYNGPVFIRPDWEMNGGWFTEWSLPAVTPAQYYAAGAWYPGNEYVDWVGIDAYPRTASGDDSVTGVDGLNTLAAWVFDAVFGWAQRYPKTVKALVCFNYGTTGNDHLLTDHPVGAAESRRLIRAAGQRVSLTVPRVSTRTALQ